MALSIVSDPELRYPAPDDDFSPGEAYPELVVPGTASTPNPVYAALRRLLAQLELDKERFGTPEWNPLGAYLRPGSRVFVLCNFVYHRRPQEGREDFASKCIHGSVLRALVDYVLKAVGPEGRVHFGNSPLQSCEWDRVLADAQADRVEAFYRRAGLPVAARDLRLHVVEKSPLGHVTSVERRDEVSLAREIDLGGDSLLAEIPGGPADDPSFRVADYDPRRIQSFHRAGSHRYVIHRELLEADAVISLSKLKTHEKVGITCGIKGFVGAVGHKDCLAHHRIGSPRSGGDEYPDRFGLLEPFSRFQDWVQKREQEAASQRMLEIVDRNTRRVLRRLGVVLGGAWHGNDTCWRMAVDLGRILHHADAEGRLHDAPQRLHLSLIDGVVAGEGDGPLDPRAVAAGTLLFGDDVAVTDRVASRLMGFDPGVIALVREAFRSMRYPISERGFLDPVECRLNGETRQEAELAPLLSRPFRPPTGWRGVLDRGA